MTVVDASVWIGAYLARDAHHARSLQWIISETASGGELLIPALALAEVAGALARRTGSASLSAEVIGRILALPTIRVAPIDHALGSRAADVAMTHKLRGADAVYVAVASVHGTSMVTWDDEVAQRAGDLVHMVVP